MYGFAGSFVYATSLRQRVNRTLAIVIAAVAWPAGYAPIGSGPDSYEEAALAWNATSSSPPPADLAYCEYDISFMAFLGPIFILAFGALALVVGCLAA